MKLMPIEETIQKILGCVHEVLPKYKIPSEEQIHLFNGPSYILGLGGTNYGVGANPRKYSAETSLNNYQFIDTIIHELVHHNGFRGHAVSFRTELARVGSLVLPRIKEKYPNETEAWEIERRFVDGTQTVVTQIRATPQTTGK